MILIIIIINYIFIALFSDSKTLYSVREGRQTRTGKQKQQNKK